MAINKAATAETASIVFQEGYSGPAEIGLAGEGALTVKNSADGAMCREAMRADPASGRVSFPAGAGGVAVTIMGNSGTPVSARQTRFLTPGLNGASQPEVYVPVPIAGRLR